MSWESAIGVLFAESPTLEQARALEKFSTEHGKELRQLYLSEYADLQPFLTRFVARMFRLYENPGTPETKAAEVVAQTVESTAVDILAQPDFFPSLFREAFASRDTWLLELVYASLFSVIPASSPLIETWFKAQQEAEQRRTKFSKIKWSIIALIGVQFIDVRQDYTAVRPKSEVLLAINERVTALREPVIRLVWALSLFFMARQHYSTDDDDGIDLEPLMQKLQRGTGVHWSVVLHDQIQVSLSGLDALMLALGCVKRTPPHIVSEQQLAQTAADVVSSLFDLSKPTDTLSAALAAAVKPYPALQSEHWINEETLMLVRAKCPGNVASVVSFAEVLSLDRRIEYLREMKTYVSEVNVAKLDVEKADLESRIGKDVRTNQVISVLPARINDHQGTLELEAGTRGTLLGYDGSECLVMWYFTYSGWSLLGRLLENADLTEGTRWQPLTLEILNLATMTMDAGVLGAMSAGLARGDIVDLIVCRLQTWLHTGVTDNVPQALAFLEKLSALDPSRVWVILDQLRWDHGPTVLSGLRGVLIAVWPTYSASLELHQRVIKKLTELFGCQYLSPDIFDVDTLDVFKLLLPVNRELQDELLSASPLRETSLAPLLSNLESRSVLDFCSFCISYRDEGLRFRSREQSYLERQLFVKSKDLVDLFLTKAELREAVLQIWTNLMLSEHAPPLLAFLESGQATQLKEKLVSIASDRLESSKTLADLAKFLISARRQEGLLDLLRNPLLSIFEERLPSMEDDEAISLVLEALKRSKTSFKPETLKWLQVRVGSDMPGTVPIFESKRRAVELLTKQIFTDVTPLKTSLLPELGKLTEALAQITGARPSLHTRLKQNLKKKWSDIGMGDESSLDLVYLDTKLNEDPIWHASYRPEVVEAIDNKRLVESQTILVQAWCHLLIAACESREAALTVAQKQQLVIHLLKANSSALPPSMQRAEEVRTETALIILHSSNSPSVQILDLLLQQLTDLTLSPTLTMRVADARLVSLLKMTALSLRNFTTDYVHSEPRVVQIVLGLLDVVVITQMRLLSNSEETLKLHVSILRDCLRLIDSDKANKMLKPLVQSMSESGADVAALRSFASMPPEKPVFGELLLLYIQEWLPAGIMTDNFVRSGLMNALIDAPLSRRIQTGDVTARQQPAMHSLWRRGILVVVLRLLDQLGSRVAQESWLFVRSYALQITTCFDQWRNGQINLALIEETMLLNAFLTLLSEVDSNPNDKVDVKFPREELVQIIEHLLSHRKYLATRIEIADNEAAVIDALGDLRDIISPAP